MVHQVVQLLDNDARGMMVHLAKILCIPATCFLQILGSTLAVVDQSFASSLEAINYALPANGADPIGCQSHVDKGLLTLIHSDSSDGLQVFSFVLERSQTFCLCLLLIDITVCNSRLLVADADLY